MNLKNIFKAWISTFIGLLIPVLTMIATNVQDGSIDWHKVGISFLATAILGLTDLLNEVKTSLNDKADKLN